MLSFSIRIPYSKSSILPLELAHKPLPRTETFLFSDVYE